MENKAWYLSKTVWANVIMALLGLFVPGAKEWLASNPEVMAGVFTGVNLLLRVLTKKGLSLT